MSGSTEARYELATSKEVSDTVKHGFPCQVFPKLVGSIDVMSTNATNHHRVADAVVAHPRTVARIVAYRRLDYFTVLVSVVRNEINLTIDDVDAGYAVMPIVHNPEVTGPDSTPDMTVLLIKDKP